MSRTIIKILQIGTNAICCHAARR